MDDVEIGPAGIRLGQFLKFVNAVETGGDVKSLLESGDVTVNGEIETRRGAQLHGGDVVALGPASWRVR